MPRQLNLDEQLRLAEEALKTDPTSRFPCVTRIVTPTYLRLIQDCIETGRPLSHVIEDVTTAYYTLLDKTGTMGLDKTTQETVRNLSILLAVSFEDAAKIVLQRTAEAVLEQELEVREAQSQTHKRVKALASGS